MAGYSQSGRLISLSVDGLDADKLLLASFKGHEAMSRLFSFNLELLMEVVDTETRQPNDPVQFADPNYEGGANAPSLSKERAYFKEIRVSDPHFKGNGRQPRAEEIPPSARY